MQLIVGIKNQPTKNKNYAATKRYIGAIRCFAERVRFELTHRSLHDLMVFKTILLTNLSTFPMWCVSFHAVTSLSLLPMNIKLCKQKCSFSTLHFAESIVIETNTPIGTHSLAGRLNNLVDLLSIRKKRGE